MMENKPINNISLLLSDPDSSLLCSCIHNFQFRISSQKLWRFRHQITTTGTCMLRFLCYAVNTPFCCSKEPRVFSLWLLLVSVLLQLYMNQATFPVPGHFEQHVIQRDTKLKPKVRKVSQKGLLQHFNNQFQQTTCRVVKASLFQH